MKRKIILSIVVVAAIAMAFKPKAGVIGTLFPVMECEDYHGKAVNLPIDTKGKYTLICCAFSTAAEPDLKTWINPIYNKFIGKVDASKADVFDAHTDYDVNLYFIPMFTGFNKLASASSKKKSNLKQIKNCGRIYYFMMEAKLIKTNWISKNVIFLISLYWTKREKLFILLPENTMITKWKKSLIFLKKTNLIKLNNLKTKTPNTQIGSFYFQTPFLFLLHCR